MACLVPAVLVNGSDFAGVWADPWGTGDRLLVAGCCNHKAEAITGLPEPPFNAECNKAAKREDLITPRQIGNHVMSAVEDAHGDQFICSYESCKIMRRDAKTGEITLFAGSVRGMQDGKTTEAAAKNEIDARTAKDIAAKAEADAKTSKDSHAKAESVAKEAMDAVKEAEARKNKDNMEEKEIAAKQAKEVEEKKEHDAKNAKEAATAEAQFSNRIYGLALGPSGMLYVADTGNKAIRAVDNQGNVTTLLKDQSGIHGLTYYAGKVIFVDGDKHVIREVDLQTKISEILAGKVGEAGNCDGQGLEARFCNPSDVCADAEGNLYVVDKGTSKLRRIVRNGDFVSVTTVACQLNRPSAVACDGCGNVYVANRSQGNILGITMSPDVCESVKTAVAAQGAAKRDAE